MKTKRWRRDHFQVEFLTTLQYGCHVSGNEEPSIAALRKHSLTEIIIVLVEVSLVTLLVPLTRMGFRDIASHQPMLMVLHRMGSGVVIVALCICLFLSVRRKDFRAYGITFSEWQSQLKIGVICSLLIASYVLLTLPILHMVGVAGHFTGWEPRGRIVGLCLTSPALPLFFWFTRFLDTIALRMSIAWTWLGLAGIWVIPLLLAWYFNESFRSTCITWLGSVAISGFGEELIFRGYIQSRLNEVLGRPYSLGGVQFGWGLFIASFFFGVVHIFNGVDFFRGNLNFQWTWAIGPFLCGVVIFGYLREKTGTILSGALTHGNNDIWALIVINLTR